MKASKICHVTHARSGTCGFETIRKARHQLNEVHGSFAPFLVWNMPYHIDYHAYFSAPFHKLPMFLTCMREHIVQLGKEFWMFNHTNLRDSLTGKMNSD